MGGHLRINPSPVSVCYDLHLRFEESCGDILTELA